MKTTPNRGAVWLYGTRGSVREPEYNDGKALVLAGNSQVCFHEDVGVNGFRKASRARRRLTADASGAGPVNCVVM